MSKDDKKQLADEIEQTFWHQFFIRIMFACATGFATTVIVFPVMVSLYAYIEGKAKQPPPVQMVVKAPDGCMEGKPAVVVDRSMDIHAFSTDDSIITLRRDKNPTFICKFETELLYNSWSVGETVYHAGGVRL